MTESTLRPAEPERRNLASFQDLPGGGRFSRQEAIVGWDQSRLAQARVLMIGVGALGNELLKNLALLGIGNLGIVDFDVLEETNLPRCALFRASDLGQPKAVVAARAVQQLSPELTVTPFVADLMTEVGAGLLEDFPLVLGAVDSAAARWKLNRLARQAGVRWIDGGVDAGCGQVSVYDRTEGACYECGLTAERWAEIHRRRSCSAPGEPPVERPPLPVALPVVALTAALQAQEAVHFLMHGATAEGLRPGERLSVSLQPYTLATVRARRRHSCLAHGDNFGDAVPVRLGTEATICELLNTAGAEALDLEWEAITALTCAQCGRSAAALPAFRLRQADLLCPACGQLRAAERQSTIRRDDKLAHCTLSDLGVPAKAHLRLLGQGGAGSFWCRMA